METLLYDNIPTPPSELSATNAIARFVDGLGFRYRWATEDLTQKEIDFRAVESSMSMMEVLVHVYEMSKWVNNIFGGEKLNEEKATDFESVREQTLQIIKNMSNRLKEMSDGEFDKIKGTDRTPTNPDHWFFLNGPLADALTHVGQITTWRRISGNPQPKGVNPFLGKKA